MMSADFFPTAGALRQPGHRRELLHPLLCEMLKALRRLIGPSSTCVKQRRPASSPVPLQGQPMSPPCAARPLQGVRARRHTPAAVVCRFAIQPACRRQALEAMPGPRRRADGLCAAIPALERQQSLAQFSSAVGERRAALVLSHRTATTAAAGDPEALGRPYRAVPFRFAAAPDVAGRCSRIV